MLETELMEWLEYHKQAGAAEYLESAKLNGLIRDYRIIDNEHAEIVPVLPVNHIKIKPFIIK